MIVFGSLLASLHTKLNQPFGGDTLSWIFTLLIYIFFAISILYGQRIQLYVWLREVEGSLYKLKRIRDEGRKIAIETIREIGKPADDLSLIHISEPTRPY